MPFTIVETADGIIEFVYPASPTEADVADYARRAKVAIDARRGGWSCLVDQRKLEVIPPDLLSQIAELNAYAQRKGMKRAARVVTTAVASLQASRIAREGSLAVPVRTFDSRDAALRWLREKPA